MGLFNRKPKPERKSYPTYQMVPFFGSQAKWTDYNTRQSYQQAFKRSTWVYACVKLRANAISSVPWLAEVWRGGEWVEAEGSPLQRLIERPNPAFDWASMMRRFAMALDLTGDGWATKVRDGSGQVRELWPILPDIMEAIPGQDALVTAYKYQFSGVTRVLPASDVLHLLYIDPGSLYYGIAPLHAAARAVDIDEEAEQWQKKSLQNMAVPPGIFHAGEDITQQQFEQYRDWVREQSGVQDARKPWVLGGSGKWQAMAQTAVELDFGNSRKFTREEICSAFAVPPPMVGIFENATLANIETARKIFWRDAILPTLVELESQINLQIASEFGSEFRLRYDASNVEALQESLTEKISNAERLWRMGVPLNELNQLLEIGLPDIEGGEIGYLPAGLLPANMDFSMSEGTDADARAAYGTPDL
jgi:HK97 family phage portal protein